MLWDEWNAFEVQNGNEDTFREMLRVKRSVCASYSQMHFNVAAAVEPQIATASIKSKSFCTVVQGEENSTAIMMTSPDVLTPANDVHFGEMKLELKPNLSAKSNPDEIDLEEHE